MKDAVVIEAQFENFEKDCSEIIEEKNKFKTNTENVRKNAQQENKQESRSRDLAMALS